MKVFLSGIDADKKRFAYIDSRIDKYYYMLMSFYYLNQEIFDKVCSKSDEVLIDSGAFTLQRDDTQHFDRFLDKYLNFIENNDNTKVLGFFELDVDNKVGYERVKSYRKELHKVTNKIIPVWHKEMGIKEYLKICEEYSGKIISITGFRNDDIYDNQFLSFLKTALKFNCKLHCLGCTRKNILETTPFYSVDSAAWCLESVYGRILMDTHNNTKRVPYSSSYNNMRLQIALNNFKIYQELQLKYKYKYKKFDEKYYNN